MRYSAKFYAIAQTIAEIQRFLNFGNKITTVPILNLNNINFKVSLGFTVCLCVILPTAQTVAEKQHFV